jgi:hypothetical protein
VQVKLIIKDDKRIFTSLFFTTSSMSDVAKDN